MTNTPLTDEEYALHPVLDTQTGGDAVRIQFVRKLEQDYGAEIKALEEENRRLRGKPNAEVILEILNTFGIEKPGRPATGDDEPFVIQIHLKSYGRTSCFGATVEMAAKRAYTWLKERGWKPSTTCDSAL